MTPCIYVYIYICTSSLSFLAPRCPSRVKEHGRRLTSIVKVPSAGAATALRDTSQEFDPLKPAGREWHVSRLEMIRVAFCPTSRIEIDSLDITATSGLLHSKHAHERIPVAAVKPQPPSDYDDSTADESHWCTLYPRRG